MEDRFKYNNYESASRQVLVDLMNSIIYENLFSILENTEILCSSTINFQDCSLDLERDEQLFQIWLSKPETSLIFPVVPAFCQPYRLSRPIVLLVNYSLELEFKFQALGPVEVITRLIESYCDRSMLKRFSRLQSFIEELKLAVFHNYLSLQATRHIYQDKKLFFASLIEAEQFASFRDRPFHPTAKAKVGWNEQDYRLYSPEFGDYFSLNWIAIRRDHVLSSNLASSSIVTEIVSANHQPLFAAAFDQIGINSADYLPLPIHPWQRSNIFPKLFTFELESNICIPLEVNTDQYRSTTSIRSLAPTNGSRKHVKVPLGIYSLGAQRLLSARQLINGEIGQLLLEQIISSDTRLQNQVFLCDETKWWIFRDLETGIFSNKSGQLSCVIRHYPSELTNREQVQLIPMSAFAVYNNSGQKYLLENCFNIDLKQEIPVDSILKLFSNICDVFVSIVFILFSYGVMPEIHGQNVLLVVRKQDIVGLLLRDFSTVRIHLPWLISSGFKAPSFSTDSANPGTLINKTPEDLLSFFQTLGIQVNLCSIIDAFSSSYGIKEFHFWLALQNSLKNALLSLDLPMNCQYVLQNSLFNLEKWPSKLVVHPLLMRLGKEGSMPSEYAKTINPFYCLKEFVD